MRIRIIQQPTVSSINGMRRDKFLPAATYKPREPVSDALLLAEGWAIPIRTNDPHDGGVLLGHMHKIDRRLLRASG
jgi:hypothetical protein